MRYADLFERELLSAGLEAAGAGLCVLDHAGTVVLVNPNFCAQFLLSESETIGRSSRRLLDNRGIDAGFLLWLTQPSSGSEYPLTLEGRPHPIDLVLRSRTLTDHEGEEFKVICSIDVTEQRARARSMTQRFPSQAGRAGVAVVDVRLPDAPIVYVNPIFEAITGYAAIEVVGLNCRLLQGSDTNQPGLQGLREAVARCANGHAVLRNYRKDGTAFLNQLFISPLRGASGEIAHYIGILVPDDGGSAQ